MFRFFPDETVLEICNKTSHEDQARLAQVDKQFNRILKDKSSELEKYKSKCTVHSVGHTHFVMQDTSYQEMPIYPFRLFVMKGNKNAPNSGMQIPEKFNNELKTAMEGGTLSLIGRLMKDRGTATRNALLLQEAFEEENRSILKNRK